MPEVYRLAACPDKRQDDRRFAGYPKDGARRASQEDARGELSAKEYDEDRIVDACC
ncbi:MAG TPA: hypothetical protein VF916_08145 [Ktedonobacterales bacterium]